MLLSAYGEPQTFQEAWHHEDPKEYEGWCTSTQKEFKDITNKGDQRNTKRINIPPNRHLFESQLFFKKKIDGQFRERLVARGYTQILGVYFTENYSPVVTGIKLRTILLMSYTLCISSIVS